MFARDCLWIFVCVLLCLVMPGEGLRWFSSRAQLINCIITCEKQVSPCVHIKNTKCQRVYMECLEKKDVYACMARSANKQLNAIAQCFEKECTPYEEPKPIPMEEVKKMERQRVQRYFNTPWMKMKQQGSCGANSGQQPQGKQQGSCGGKPSGKEGSCGGSQQGSCGGNQQGSCGGKQSSCGGQKGSCGGKQGGCNKSQCGGSSSFDAFFLLAQ